jgi:hypothetical protein
MVLLRTLYKFLLIAALTLLASGVASAAPIGAQLGVRPPEASPLNLLIRETIPAVARPYPYLTFQGGGALGSLASASDLNAVALSVPFEEFPLEAARGE